MITPDWMDVIAHGLALSIAIVLTIHGLDDLFVDLAYYLRGLRRSGQERPTIEALRAKSAQRVAIMVPAWQEAAVIDRMLENALATLDYDPDQFEIFVGTYPNDPDTRRKVGLVSTRAPNVHEVVVPHDGPTSKADCLRWIYQGIERAEERSGIRFDILVMQGAEDVIHPLALRHYNYWIPRCDFVQTPVLPLEAPLSRVIGGTYVDELTERQLKDMIVRAGIGGLVPSLGVGSAFARDAFEEIAGQNGQLALDVESLTAAYELGLELRLAGMKTLFAADTAPHDREVRGPDGRVRRTRVEEHIATREHFPTTLRAAIRQRSRWILGVVFQGWEKIGWQGPLPVLHSLYRDRRVLLSHLVALGGYLIAAYCLLRIAIGSATGSPWHLQRLFEPGTLLSWLVIVDLCLVAWRMCARALVIERVYGWPQSLMSIARFPIAHVVSLLATASAARQFLAHRLGNEPLRWEKTDHELPDVEPLHDFHQRFHQRLGDILRTREGLSADDLARGLALSGQSGHKLGEVLVQIGAASGAAIDRAIATQRTLPAVVPDPEAIPRSLLSAVSESECEALGALPLSESGAWAIVACSDPSVPSLAATLADRLGRRIRLAYCGSERLAVARQRAYRRLRRDGRSGVPSRLGERLVFAGVIDEATLRAALAEQVETREHLAELLVRRGAVDAAMLAELALPPVARFVSISTEHVDTFALRRLGYAACAFHDLVPCWPTTGDRAIVSASPLHADTLARIEGVLETPLRPLLASRAELRAVRMSASQRAWPRGVFGGRTSTDAAELAAMADAGIATPSIEQLEADACALDAPPIALAVERGVLDPLRAVELVARAYLIEPAERAEHRRGWLPPELEARGDLRVIGVAPDELTIAVAHPDASLARDLRALHPDRALRWCVVPMLSSALSESA